MDQKFLVSNIFFSKSLKLFLSIQNPKAINFTQEKGACTCNWFLINKN